MKKLCGKIMRASFIKLRKQWAIAALCVAIPAPAFWPLAADAEGKGVVEG